MNKLALLLLCISAIIFSSDSATAGSIGTPIPADGEDWEIYYNLNINLFYVIVSFILI
ncbi:MAG: hypothetical protein OSB59_05700 [Candidatus Poseidoniia archaeon]|nr:hypothetical protein [Candidatus Poseidoniia archaeon]